MEQQVGRIRRRKITGKACVCHTFAQAVQLHKVPTWRQTTVASMSSKPEPHTEPLHKRVMHVVVVVSTPNKAEAAYVHSHRNHAFNDKVPLDERLIRPKQESNSPAVFTRVSNLQPAQPGVHGAHIRTKSP